MDLSAVGRYHALQKSFRNAMKCLYGVCSREVVKDAFPSFTDAERERLYRLLMNVMRSMHDNIVEEFNEDCQQKQVAAALDKLDEFVEQHNLDKLASSDKISVAAIIEKVSRMRKDKIEYLADELKKIEESNNAMKAQIALLKKEEVSTAARDLVNKIGAQWESVCLAGRDIGLDNMIQ